MKRILAGALVVVLVVVLAACSTPPASGTVTAKHYTAPYSWMSLECALWRTDGKGVMSCAYYMPHTHEEPAEYELCLRDDKDANHTGCFDVDPAEWRRYTVGQHYPRTEQP